MHEVHAVYAYIDNLEKAMSSPLLLVSSVDEAIENINNFNDAVNEGHERVIRLIAHVQSWYVIQKPDGNFVFGPSKFIGYANMTPELYAKEATANGRLDGRVTESRLSRWAKELTSDDRQFVNVTAALASFCARFDKHPNVRARISLLSTEVSGITEADKVRALSVLIAELSESAKRDLKRIAFP